MLQSVTGSIRSQSQTWLSDWITTANNYNIIRFLIFILLIYGKESACNAGELDPILGLGWQILLEKGMAIYTNILVWRIPWTELLNRLQFMKSQGVKHDWVTNTFGFFSWPIYYKYFYPGGCYVCTKEECVFRFCWMECSVYVC